MSLIPSSTLKTDLQPFFETLDELSENLVRNPCVKSANSIITFLYLNRVFLPSTNPETMSVIFERLRKMDYPGMLPHSIVEKLRKRVLTIDCLPAEIIHKIAGYVSALPSSQFRDQIFEDLHFSPVLPDKLNELIELIKSIALKNNIAVTTEELVKIDDLGACQLIYFLRQAIKYLNKTNKAHVEHVLKVACRIRDVRLKESIFTYCLLILKHDPNFNFTDTPDYLFRLGLAAYSLNNRVSINPSTYNHLIQLKKQLKPVQNIIIFYRFLDCIATNTVLLENDINTLIQDIKTDSNFFKFLDSFTRQLAFLQTFKDIKKTNLIFLATLDKLNNVFFFFTKEKYIKNEKLLNEYMRLYVSFSKCDPYPKKVCIRSLTEFMDKALCADFGSYHNWRYNDSLNAKNNLTLQQIKEVRPDLFSFWQQNNTDAGRHQIHFTDDPLALLTFQKNLSASIYVDGVKLDIISSLVDGCCKLLVIKGKKDGLLLRLGWDAVCRQPVMFITDLHATNEFAPLLLEQAKEIAKNAKLLLLKESSFGNWPNPIVGLGSPAPYDFIMPAKEYLIEDGMYTIEPFRLEVIFDPSLPDYSLD